MGVLSDQLFDAKNIQTNIVWKLKKFLLKKQEHQNYTASERNLPKCALHSLFAWKRTYIYWYQISYIIIFLFFNISYYIFRWTKVLKLASKAELQNLDEDLESSKNKADLKRNSSFTSSTSTTNSIQSADWTTSSVENSWTSGGNGNSFRKQNNFCLLYFSPPD